MTYRIRPMTVDDIMSVIEGEEKVFHQSLGYDMLYTDLTLNPYAYYFVLEINRQIGGYMGLWITDHAEVINFYIDPSYQSQGYGTMFLEFALDLCESSHVPNMVLEVRVSNHIAIHLYEKYGFEKKYMRENYYEDGESAWVMIKNWEDKL